jgi:hypothetical protein
MLQQKIVGACERLLPQEANQKKKLSLKFQSFAVEAIATGIDSAAYWTNLNHIQ